MGGVYTNSYFHFTLGIPTGWAVDAIKPAAASGQELPVSARTKGQPTAHQLLILSENRSATSNPSLLIMAEKTAAVPGVKNAKDYLVLISRLMADAPIAYRPMQGIADVTVGGAPAVRLDFSARLTPQKTARQSYLISQRNDHILSFILSASSEQELRQLEQALQTVKFH
jgi:hypothetical protein